MPVGEFIKRAKHAADYDFLSLHPYAFGATKANPGAVEQERVVKNVSKRVMGNIQAARGALDVATEAEGQQKKPIWVTELGWPVKPGPVEEDGHHHLVTDGVQRDLLNSTFNRMKKYSSAKSGSFDISRIFWYNIKDNPGSIQWDAHCGLVLGGAGGVRLAWKAFQNQAK
jgi:hypothetical protein